MEGSEESWERFLAWQSIIPGTKIRHTHTGSTHEVERRKYDDTGWWLTDGSGICDKPILLGHFEVVDFNRPKADGRSLKGRDEN